MTALSLLKTTSAISTLLLITACSTFQKTGVFEQNELNQRQIGMHFTRMLQSEDWLANEYRTYLNKKGNKAFAVFWNEAGRPIASGFADDKLSIDIARKEALRLCQAYSRSQRANCLVEDQEGTNRAPLNPADYPKEIIAYRDVDHWQDYLSTSGHKAIAGNRSGVLGGSEGDTKQEAELNALSQCKINTHASISHCYIIASE
ncbi:hypothetical protein [Marinomonas ostreistagni]|uniref:DUF4189 domain-containing protein n=1 Tax=Marinomonas ostreistagni TaxID=359209 RepID=A0ABS0ZEN2_9GAMM|nr:hypothetical protein [Marinomonas ostreistagni]MBJ7552133.1 hypothetical protein [Marinomonas ostreistagni]